MRWSESFIPTMKEVPTDAEVPSHQLMLRAGLVRQLMAGAYSYLPLGWRSVRKASQIVREEMEAIGATELHMPAVQPIELFHRTGRYDAFGSVLVNFEVPRGGKKVHWALGPTHEEVVTDLMSKHISSYKQLPLTVFQIQTKFRNEERPRFGVLRTSEFLMKDAYSFSTSVEQLDDIYEKMYGAYCRIFARCGLEYLPVEAESGPIGGDASHEFMIPAPNGEDTILRCPTCDYAANMERAEIGENRKGDWEVSSAPEGQPEKVHTPNVTTIEQVAEFLKQPVDTFVKTLIYMADGEPVAVLVQGKHEVNEGKLRRVLDVAEVAPADEKTVREVTGAPVGFAGPIGLNCKVVADRDLLANRYTSMVTGANEKDHHLTGVVLARDIGLEEAYDLRNAVDGDPCPRCDGTLEEVAGIEVGHVFKLGTKYSEALGANYLDEKETRHPIIMGCYGIGVNRIVAGLAETRHDDNGLIWPLSVAPHEVLIVPLSLKDEEAMKIALDLYDGLRGNGVDVLLDDRDARPGVKFKDADLIGFPLRLVIGGRGLKEGVAELKWRTDDEPSRIPLADVQQTVLDQLAERRAEESRNVPG